jgi:NAD+ synthase
MSTMATSLVADVRHEDVLRIDPVAETERIVTALRTQVGSALRRRGLVLGMSGGVDSSVCAALAARAVGAGRVLALLMPERDSDPESRTIASEWAERLGVDYLVEDITPILDGARCYERRDDAIRRIVPDFDAGWRCKVVLPSGRGGANRLNVSQLAVQPPGGEVRLVRLPSDVYLQIVAATNFKQRVRKMLEYYHADRLHYAVVGTPNRLEYDQGFFVKGGDGLADVKPIAHLYKTQVYQLAHYLGVPASVTSRPPTTDTYSLPQSQEEFYFSLPAALMDRALRDRNAGVPADETARATGLSADEVERAFRDIEQKRSTTRYLHAPPLLVEPVAEIDAGLEELR